MVTRAVLVVSAFVIAVLIFSGQIRARPLAVSAMLNRVMQVTMMQGNADPEYRGRVNSLAWALSGLVPLWKLPAGTLDIIVFAAVGLSIPKILDLE